MKTINVAITPAPDSPLNLRLGIVYSPRLPTDPFAGFDAIEVGIDTFAVRAYVDGDVPREVFRGGLALAYVRLAAHLRMDVKAETFFTDSTP
jgi:hypothetical protein